MFYDKPYKYHPKDLSDGTTRTYRYFGGTPDRTEDQVETNARLRRLAVRETFFWKEKTHDGVWARLLTIRVTFDMAHMIGIEFIYESGISRQLGIHKHIHDAVCTSYDLNLEADEQVVLFTMQVGKNSITDIAVSPIQSVWPSSTNKASYSYKRIAAKLSTSRGLHLPMTQELLTTPSTWLESRCLSLQSLLKRTS